MVQEYANFTHCGWWEWTRFTFSGLKCTRSDSFFQGSLERWRAKNSRSAVGMVDAYCLMRRATEPLKDPNFGLLAMRFLIATLTFPTALFCRLCTFLGCISINFGFFSHSLIFLPESSKVAAFKISTRPNSFESASKLSTRSWSLWAQADARAWVLVAVQD